MFSILNRIRGMYSWFRPLYALCIGMVVGLVTGNLYVAICSWLLAWGGVAMGWGDWDCVATNREATKPSPYIEGSDNGIQWLAEKIISSDKNWLNHCRVCLVLDGAYRAIWILPMMYTMGWSALVGFIVLTPMFWLASELGYWTTKWWNFKYMTGGWEHQEIWYGSALGGIYYVTAY